MSYWVLRYTANSKRKKITFGQFHDLSLADAKAGAAIKKREVNLGAAPNIPKRVYTKDIRHFIGNPPIDHVKALTIREIIQNNKTKVKLCNFFMV